MVARIKARTKQWGRDLAGWMEERTSIMSMLEKGAYEPTPRRGMWLYTLGSATLFLITLQFLTGILLLFYYVPSTDEAWDSIYYIMHNVYFGYFIRGIHFWSANVLLLVIGLHMVRTFLSGSYKPPRELNWVVGVLLILIVTIMAFTGYAMRWDMEGFYAWEVGLKISSYTPVIGKFLITTLLGGDTIGPATLSRVFAIHVWLLPAVLAPLIGVHLYLLRLHGEFGAPFEYSERLAKLRRRRQMQEYLGDEEESAEEGE